MPNAKDAWPQKLLDLIGHSKTEPSKDPQHSPAVATEEACGMILICKSLT
jgi:hypothetical protein